MFERVLIAAAAILVSGLVACGIAVWRARPPLETKRDPVTGVVYFEREE